MRLSAMSQNLRDLHPQQLCRAITLGKNARLLVPEKNSALDLFDAFCERQLWFDSTMLLAHALHRRAAIWWARLVCDDTTAVDSLPRSNMLLLVEAWIRDPAQENVHAIIAALAAHEKDDALYWLGMAVRWSVATLESQPGHHVRATPYLYASAVSAAIDMCASQCRQSSEREQFYRKALARGRDIAQGGNGRLQKTHIFSHTEKNQKLPVAHDKKSG